MAEIQSDEYTKLLCGGRVQSADILDCIVCTQTLLLIYDYRSAIQTLHKMLKADGILLVTIPGICRCILRNMMGAAEGDWWRFTGDSARRIVA